MSDQYLKGFNDGYEKAMLQVKNQNHRVIVSSREIAEDIYKDITELQERDKRIEQQYT